MKNYRREISTLEKRVANGIECHCNAFEAFPSIGSDVFEHSDTTSIKHYVLEFKKISKDIVYEVLENIYVPVLKELETLKVINYVHWNTMFDEIVSKYYKFETTWRILTVFIEEFGYYIGLRYGGEQSLEEYFKYFSQRDYKELHFNFNKILSDYGVYENISFLANMKDRMVPVFNLFYLSIQIHEILFGINGMYEMRDDTFTAPLFDSIPEINATGSTMADDVLTVVMEEFLYKGNSLYFSVSTEVENLNMEYYLISVRISFSEVEVPNPAAIDGTYRAVYAKSCFVKLGTMPDERKRLDVILKRLNTLAITPMLFAKLIKAGCKITKSEILFPAE